MQPESLMQIAIVVGHQKLMPEPPVPVLKEQTLRGSNKGHEAGIFSRAASRRKEPIEKNNDITPAQRL
jgi:hypothetical protein